MSVPSPRFPQPFLDLLGTFCSWRSVLALTSVDRREAPMREYWINDKSAVLELAIEIEHRDELLPSFVTRFPRCVRRRTSSLFAATVFFSGAVLKRSRVFDQEALDNAALRKSLRLHEYISGGIVLGDELESITLHEDFGYVTSRFLFDLPPELRARRDFFFADRRGPGQDLVFVRVTSESNATTVKFWDSYDNSLTAPLNAVLAALEGARLRLHEIMRLVDMEKTEEN